MRAILIFLSVMWLALPVRAETVRKISPAVQAAAREWLAGQEADALRAFAKLAADGDVSARLWLGQIDSFAALQGDWLGQLGRADRIAVLRQPGGFSGRHWTKAATPQTDPIAMAWAQLWDTGTGAEVILQFARLGETRAARFAALTLARRQRLGFAGIADDPDYPPSLWAYAMREGWLPPQGGLDAADPQRAILGQAFDSERFSNWVATAPEADAVVALCEVLCPTEPATVCRPAALQALGGYWGLMPLGSPVEAIVPSPLFNRSPAGIATTLRHMKGPVDSACLTAALK